ncbi:metallophosphoesterase [Candidatus Uabimicrobium amorphum]|uniref:3',5'-cyclic adenosine monophosphatephosphodiesterase CpdA n=1 Tax=Uabimicrobium amorphum TaxID=2596890 RepID=A0A5S9IRY6_UABAM|nr:metallophosphoesterase [Candidatus Uabimicrobium amorphum]BBM86351.1 3',5'-cyclic adenosine monophosphatephosphodiesterase CpdA [Candidatus Uabimicrobium amorphum]
MKILSPNLGCPLVVDVQGEDCSLPVIASLPITSWKSDIEAMEVQIVPSHSPDAPKFSLHIKNAYCIEHPDGTRSFSHIEQTRDVISLAVQQALVPSDHTIVHLEFCLSHVVDFVKEKHSNQLFDLQVTFEGRVVENIQSLYIASLGNRPVRLLQINDLHLAKRNDTLESYAATFGENSFINSNRHFRHVLQQINCMAQKGELDGVLIIGDLVDFSGVKLEEEIPGKDNNWQLFLKLVRESKLSVPIFTCTGNHDWRVYPYNLFHFGYHKDFGISKKLPFDPYHLNSPAEVKKTIKKFAKTSPVRSACIAASIFAFVFLIGILWATWPMTSWQLSLSLLLYVFVQYGIHTFSRLFVIRGTIPMCSDIRSLIPYFENITPYFNLAVRFGQSTIILMESGADIFYEETITQQSPHLQKQINIYKGISEGIVKTNGFWEKNLYSDFPQLHWLEEVLKLNPKGTIIAMHASIVCDFSTGTNQILLKEREGYVGHNRELFLQKCDKKVLAILTGHAHENAQVLLWRATNGEFYLRECCGFAKLPSSILLTTTAAVGPKYHKAEKPPYSRLWEITPTKIIRFDLHTGE